MADPGGGEGLPPEIEAARLEAMEVASLMHLSLEQIIHAGHEAILRSLVAKVRVGTASHQEMAILRNLLRDNGMTLGLAPNDPNRPVRTLEHQELPQLEPPDYENTR